MYAPDDGLNIILSNILGWSSIACWVVVYTPQIWENYVLQSGEGVSVAFVLIWLAGDLANLIGAIFTKLLPTVIILAAYFALCDSILWLQIYYYRYKRRHRISAQEQEPLLGEAQAAKVDEVESATVLALRYTGCLVFVFATGAIAWYISRSIEHQDPVAKPVSRGYAIAGQALGWSSAILFLGARIPQILKNLTTRCEGLSPAMFFFSIFGNLTYAASIFAKSLEHDYLMKNAAWLAGSLLTVFLDLFVISQFVYYRTRRTSMSPASHQHSST